MICRRRSGGWLISVCRRPAANDTRRQSARLLESRSTARVRGEKIEAGLLDEETPAAELTRALLSLLWTGETAIIKDPAEISAIGHRIVHGGTDYDSAQLINSTVEKKDR